MQALGGRGMPEHAVIRTQWRVHMRNEIMLPYMYTTEGRSAPGPMLLARGKVWACACL